VSRYEEHNSARDVENMDLIEKRGGQVGVTLKPMSQG
jgi:hypothetical protein